MSYDLCKYIGGLTKFNRSQRELPKEHWIDAACVGESTPEKLEIENVRPLTMKAMGHGSRRMRRNDASGFPARKKNGRFVEPRSGGKASDAPRTGDIVIVEVLRGKNAGRHVGRVTVRRDGRALINGKIEVGKNQLLKTHRSDGYNYSYEAAAKLKQGNEKALGHSTSLP
jgi:hypothetical protein